jgi:hypothetical protein
MKDVLKFFYNTTIEFIVGSGADTSPLTKGLDTYLPEMYEYAKTIMDTVMKPMAYTIMALFLLLELKKIAEKAESQGTDIFGVPNEVGKLAFKLAITLLTFWNLNTILNAFVSVGIEMIQKIQGVIKTEKLSTGDMNKFLDTMDKQGFWVQLGVFMVLMIVCLAALLCSVVVKALIAVRFLEMYLLVAVSPLPISTLPNEEWSTIGKNFFKMFGAHSLQGVLLFLVISFFPILMNSGLSFGGDNALAQVGGLLGYVVVLVLLLFGMKSLANKLMTVS